MAGAGAVGVEPVDNSHPSCPKRIDKWIARLALFVDRHPIFVMYLGHLLLSTLDNSELDFSSIHVELPTLPRVVPKK